jgi:hypothetical protein
MTTTDEPRSRSAPDEASNLPRARPYLDPPRGPLRTPRFTPRRPPAPEPAHPVPEPGPPPAQQPGAEQQETGQPPPSPTRHDRPRFRRPARGGPGARAVIGDEIRIPIMWCEFGSCIARYTHPGALGERDLRARALAAGWCYDALGRLACPDCVQHDSAFWPTWPPVPFTGRWRRLG